MVLIKLAKVSGELVGHDYVMTFGKLHTDCNILQHLCKLMASKTNAEFITLSCLCPSDQLREWYGPAAALLDDIFLEVLTVQSPSLSSVVVVPTSCIAAHLFQRLLAGPIKAGLHAFPNLSVRSVFCRFLNCSLDTSVSTAISDGTSLCL